MRRPLVDADDAISRLLEERYDLPTPNRIGEIVAVAIYNNYRPPNIEITFVTSSPRWASRRAIQAMLRYPFVQLRCARTTALTDARNARARALLRRIGFRPEGFHADALPNADAVSYGLLAKDAARWIA